MRKLTDVQRLLCAPLNAWNYETPWSGFLPTPQQFETGVEGGMQAGSDVTLYNFLNYYAVCKKLTRSISESRNEVWVLPRSATILQQCLNLQ